MGLTGKLKWLRKRKSEQAQIDDLVTLMDEVLNQLRTLEQMITRLIATDVMERVTRLERRQQILYQYAGMDEDGFTASNSHSEQDVS